MAQMTEHTLHDNYSFRYFAATQNLAFCYVVYILRLTKITIKHINHDIDKYVKVTHSN